MKILMRMGMSPFDNLDLYEVMAKDTIGTNAGNMLFPYSIMKNIYKEGMIIDSYKNAIPNDAEYINNNYDMFLIPLANAFRDDFIGELRNLTKLVRNLKIPCIVIGVGLQTAYEPNLNQHFKFDEDVVNFCNAILEKSTSIGVRGEITAQYLRNLGISESKICVIGCPSMFSYGDFLPLKKPRSLTRETKISLTYAGRNIEYFKFLDRIKTDYPNYCYILQKIYELRLLYAGDTVPEANFLNSSYVGTSDSRSFINGQMRMFINVPSWINYLSSSMDLAVGCCIHGSIASVLAGNPTLVFAFDSRVRELAEYHNIPLRKMRDINSDTNLKSIYEYTDFSSVLKGHKERYNVFRDFLRKNGISCEAVSYNENTDFDKKISSIKLNCPEGVAPYTTLPLEIQEIQLNRYLKFCQGKIKWCKQMLQDGNPNPERIKNIMNLWENSKYRTINNINNLR